MEISLKSIVAIALAGAATLGAVSANADVLTPASGNGELTLFVRDSVTGVVYARGLGATLNDFATEAFTSGAYTGPTSVEYSLPSVAHDANFTAFLAGTAGHEVMWGVLGGDLVGTNQAGNPRRVAFTTNDDLVGTQTVPGNLQITGASGSINDLLVSVNEVLPDASGSSVYGPDQLGGQYGNPGTFGDGAQQVYTIVAGNSAMIGSPQAFYLSTSQTGGNGVTGRLFQAISLQLDANGDLHAVAPVPLPAAAWLLGSGLIGLAGIGRRRRAAAVVKA